MRKNKIIAILLMVLFWRLYISLVIVFFKNVVNLQNNFLGGGKEIYLKAPWFYALSNFDGEHYISIAQHGYKPLQYFFFPLYPFIIKGFIYFFNFQRIFVNYVLISQVLSLIFLFLSLLMLNKLLVFKNKQNLFVYLVFLVLFFPTSFYFSATYTESLFLLLAISFFYFLEREKIIYASFAASFAGATRVVGIVLPIVLFIEIYLIYKKDFFMFKRILKNLVYMLISFLGTLLYLVYLKYKTNDFLEFIHNVSIYGDQRSNHLILLPQVFYRYLFKILPSLDYNYFPIVYTTYLEMLTAVMFGFLIYLVYKKYGFKYFLFSAGAYIIPSLSGSFSSFPRYVLVIFPVFMILSEYFSKLKKYQKVFFAVILVILFNLSLLLFANGYWIS